MDVLSSPTSLALAAGGAIFLLYRGYRSILPKPLAGIPYNKDAASKLLGDIPEMMGYVIRTKRIFCWLTSMTTRHQSPIVQIFMKPGSLPWVVLTDPQESQDILLRRTKEFDRSGMFGELVGGILPEQHIQFLSSDARFKNNRNLINQLMAPSFISKISAPEIYQSVCTLIKVWQIKCDAARGRPFSAHHDIAYGAMDSIFASSFGLTEAESITSRRFDAVSRWIPEIPDNVDKPVPFPDGKVPEIFEAILTLENSIMNTQLSPVPRFTSWVLRQFPYMRKATAIKDKYIRSKVDESVRRIESGDLNARSAMHSVLLREKDMAAKEGRPPAYQKRAIADEFFGFMMAGHDTSATAVAWGVKYLSDNQPVQYRLRAELRAALPQAAQERRALTYQELSKVNIPYLDAVVEEVLRLANVITFVARIAMQDTTILGHAIPKGTEVFMMGNGASYLEPNIYIGDASRSPGARRESGRALTGLWDDDGIGAFRPERWLAKDPDTEKEVFDSLAGPTLAFGLGPRGCFGRKLALMGLRMEFAMMIWHFNLLETPKELNGYEAVQKFALEPKQCYVRLSNALVEA